MSAPPAIPLEKLLMSPAAFGLTTASNLQRAVCRIIDGLPLGDLANCAEVKAAVGDVTALPTVPPAEVLLLSGIRTAKSLIAAATAVRASQTCDLSGLGAGETPRVSVVSLTTDLARVVFDHIVGNVMARPALKALLIGEPTSDSIMLRHPSGRAVEIKVVAGARAGASLVARWSAGCIFDEAPRMIGAEDGVVNYDDCHAAVIGRLLPGAQIISIGSPWAPFGPIYERVMERHGKPSSDLVIVRAPAQHMNPVHWTPERIAELNAKDPQVYQTDILAEFADPETSLFGSVEFERVTRKEPAELPREPNHFYVAVMDPATRGNAWTLAIATKKPMPVKDPTVMQAIAGLAGRPPMRWRTVVVFVRQWIGSKVAPLSADATLAEIAAICDGYGVTDVQTDQWAADPLRDIALRHGLTLYDRTITATLKVERFETLRARIADEEYELPPDPVVRADLLAVRKRVTQNGIAIELPRTSDGRHADYAAALAQLEGMHIMDPRLAVGPKPGSPEWMQREAAKAKELAIREAGRRARREFRGWANGHGYR
jgi:hypothetical protein